MQPRYSSDRKYHEVFTTAKDIYIGEAEPKFYPPCSVHDVDERGTLVYSEVGIVSEAEVTKLSGGFTPQQLKLPEANKNLVEDNHLLRNEQGTPQKLYLISLLGLPCSTAMSLRKMRLYSRVTLNLENRVLPAERQLEQEQGIRIFGHCYEGMLKKLPHGVKSVGRWQVPDLPSLVEKATAEQKNRQEQESLDIFVCSVKLYVKASRFM